MTADRYVKQIVKKIKCSGKKRKEISRQLLSDINQGFQQGESMSAIMLRMGEPIAIAEEFNQNLSHRERKLYKRGIALKVIVCITAVIAVFALAAVWFMPKIAEIGSSGIFTAAEVEERSREIIRLLDAEDYEGIKDLSMDEVSQILTRKVIDQAKDSIASDWGDFREFGNCYMQECRQRGETIAIVQINAAYENTGVTYTLLFNEQMELAGLYMK